MTSPFDDEPSSGLTGVRREEAPAVPATISVAARTRESAPDTEALGHSGERAARFRRGDMLEERYRIERVIGAGGMGEVYVATDERLGRRVAIKALREKMATRSSSCDRFTREAQVMSQLRHPGVAKVYDFGVQNDTAYLVLELLQGETVEEGLMSRDRFETSQAVSVACQVLATLSSVHASGFIHRDIKPSNIFVAETAQQKTVKLLDFGLTRSMDPNAVRLTKPGAVLGTPQYMAPATIRQKDIGERVDLYAVAVTLYEMLTGELPYPLTEEDSLVTMFRTILREPPLSIRVHLPQLDQALADAVMRGLSKDPDQGYESAIEMLDAIDAAVGYPYRRSELSRAVPAKSNAS